MNLMFLVSAILVAMSNCGLVKDHHKATSFQNFKMEHFHAAPTHLKHDEDYHPISKGNTESKIEVHHGDKHVSGYGVAHVQSNIDGHFGHHEFIASGGLSHEHDDAFDEPLERVHKGLKYELGDDGHYHHHETVSYESEEGGGDKVGAADESGAGDDDASYQYKPEEKSSEHYEDTNSSTP